MSRYSRGLAAMHAASTSWSIKFAKKDDNGNLTRWRVHYNASLQRPGTPAEHQAARDEARTKARTKARAKAQALTENPTVVWVTVYPPLTSAIFGSYRKGTPDRLAPVSRWTRRKGWVTEEQENKA